LFSPVGTDAFSFNIAGLPASGVLTGRTAVSPSSHKRKSACSVVTSATRAGTSEGRRGCVDNAFRCCDKIGKNDPALVTFVSRAFGNAVVQVVFVRIGFPYPGVSP
jgi:hypothetical protein